MCREDAVYEVGDQVTARWRISRVPLDQVQGVEISVLWHTEGKGDEDLHVHHFHRLDEQQLRQAGLTETQSLSCKLPYTPLSYHGHLIRVCWCLRLRLFVAGARETVSEQPFHLVSNRLRANAPLGCEMTNQDSANPSRLPADVKKSLDLKKGFVHHSRSSRLATASSAKRY
ncbi:hypothetical protein [Novipirellula maiorica]|uniref:hypothetical protein n=1 Tax=Novipirellula maiorica TaxID=1265734 RepID=UPI0003498346|nr:hypothetical protein [Rhodopirellula maiorica]